jgi:hypothetical protein
MTSSTLLMAGLMGSPEEDDVTSTGGAAEVEAAEWSL